MKESPPPKYLYKYRSLASTQQMEFAYRLIVENEVKFSTPEELNDPFEFHCQVIPPRNHQDRAEFVKYLANRYQKDPRDVDQRLDSPEFRTEYSQELVKIARKTVTVFSAAEMYSDPAMWAYYADEHKGICVELCNDVLFSDPYKIDYPETNKPPSLEIQKLRNHDSLLTVIGTKACSWKHEKEWRYIELHPDSPPNPHLVNIPDDMITGVILGARIEDWKRDIVEHWLTLRNRSYRLWEAELKDGEYRIERNLIRERK